MIVDKNLPACPVATTVGLIGNKWKILILRDVLGGPKRFGELRKSLEGISQKVLTDNLRDMEKDGLLIRKVFPEVPPRVEYSLSDIGETMRPIIKQLEEWGSMYKEIVAKG
jgi:DNA-binding HxlR family transcriptional regulator